MGDKRAERMLEELLRLPGNDTCADCHAPAPRWASVNLGIFLCVGCASVHRKMGTHRSRVKSVTLDTWSREQIASMRAVGNTASNALWNPDERHHPPPTSSMAEERDSEMERYIRKKYELGAFKGGAASSSSSSRAPVEPTSLNRARERDGRLPPSADPWAGRENRRNPELNDVVVRSRSPGALPPAAASASVSGVGLNRDRDLPPIPLSAGAPPRRRPSPVKPAPTPIAPASTNSTGVSGLSDQGQLISLDGGQSSTLPLQLNTGFPPPTRPQLYQPSQQHFQLQPQSQQFHPQSTFQPSAQFGLSPQPMNTWLSTSPMQSFQPQSVPSTSFLPSQSPQPQYGQNMPMMSMSTGTPMGMGMSMQPTGMQYAPPGGFQPQMSGQYIPPQPLQQQQYAGLPGQMAMGYTNPYGMR